MRFDIAFKIIDSDVDEQWLLEKTREDGIESQGFVLSIPLVQ